MNTKDLDQLYDGLALDNGLSPNSQDSERPILFTTQNREVLTRWQSHHENLKEARKKIFTDMDLADPKAYKLHFESSLSEDGEPGSTGSSSSAGEEKACNQALKINAVVPPQHSAGFNPQNLHFAQFMVGPQNLNSFQRLVATQSNNLLRQAANYQHPNFAGQFTRPQNNSFLQQGIHNYYLGQSDGLLQGNSPVQHIISPQNHNNAEPLVSPQNNNAAAFEVAAPQNNNAALLQAVALQNNNAAGPQIRQNNAQNRVMAARRNPRNQRNLRNPLNPGNHQNQYKNHQGTLIAKAQGLCQNLQEDEGLFGRVTRLMDPQRKVDFRAWIQTYQRDFKTWNSILRWLRTDEYFGGIFLDMMDRFLSEEFEMEYNASINEGNQMYTGNRALLRREITKEFYRSKFGYVGQALNGDITNDEFERMIRTSTLNNFQNVIEEGQE